MSKGIALLPVLLLSTVLTGHIAEAEPFEFAPLFRAADVLGADAVSGKNYRIEETVTNNGTMNLFKVTSPEITLPALGNKLALQRAQEMRAIAAIRKVKKTDAYMDGMEAAIAGPLASAKEAITHPVETLKAVPGAISQLVGDIKSAVSNIGKDDGDREDDQMFKDLIGYNKTKRRLAKDLGVDPYSSNKLLQDELDDLAWASFAGDATVNVAVAVTTTGVGVVAGTLDRVTASDDLILENGASSLANMSRRHLMDMGLDEGQANKFLSNMRYSVSQQTRLVQALAVMQKVPGRNAFIALAEGATNEDDARFHQRTAEVIGAFHQQTEPVSRLVFENDAAFFMTSDGRTFMPLVADYLAWTPQTAKRLSGIMSLVGDRSLLLTGRVSALSRQNLETAGVHIQESMFDRIKDRIAVIKIEDLEPKEAAIEPAEEESSSTGLSGVAKSVGNFFTKVGDADKEQLKKLDSD